MCAHHTCYIGMVKDNEDSTSRSDWRWSDGSAVDYQNWDSHGEGKKSGETKTAIFREDKGWHDWGTHHSIIHYINLDSVVNLSMCVYIVDSRR